MSLRPAEVARSLLAALDATEGRRRRRARNTTPDAIGMAVKRGLLEAAALEDPEPDAFDAWLLAQATRPGIASGPVLAMAREILDEWRLARSAPAFRAWLAKGAPSDDRSV